MQKLIDWFDRNGLFYLAAFLLLFIPLWPKIPLFQIFPNYVVPLRVDDVVIFLAAAIWLVQLIRKKVSLPPLITRLAAIYLVVGLLSVISALLITKTVLFEPDHVLKLLLHYFRRIEYLSLLFIFYGAVKHRSQAKKLILLLPVALMAVAVYGIGQKYFYWPVYSTMDPQYVGMRLYLTENARVSSTFAGHYDAAAYTVLVIMVVLSLLFWVKDKRIRILTGLAFAGGLWLLVLGASRTSFAAYLLAVTALPSMAYFIKSRLKLLAQWASIMAISLVVLVAFGDLADRFNQVVGFNLIPTSWSEALSRTSTSPPPEGAGVDTEGRIVVPSDERPVTEKPGEVEVEPEPVISPMPLPGDVYQDIPLVFEVEDETTGEKVITTVPRGFSENAYKYGLSMAIRLDVLWPQAIDGFKRNPLLGSGYSTLNKSQIDQFSVAESTDNDYLRNLGETGLLGFLSFFGLVVAVMVRPYGQLKQVKDPVSRVYLVGFAAGGLGLLANALFIDVFEASKVAETFWAMGGLALAIPPLYSGKK